MICQIPQLLMQEKMDDFFKIFLSSLQMDVAAPPWRQQQSYKSADLGFMAASA